MRDEQNNTTETSQDEQIFSDLLNDSRLSSLQIEEPEFDSFDVQSAIREAKSVTRTRKTNRVFGKRSKRLFRSDKAEPSKDVADEAFFSSKAEQPASSEDQYKSVSAALQEVRQDDEQPAAASGSDLPVHPAVEPADDENTAQPKTSLPADASDKAAQEPGVTPVQDQPAAEASAAEKPKPRTFAQILNSTQYQNSQRAIQDIDTTPILSSSDSLGTFDGLDVYPDSMTEEQEIRSASHQNADAGSGKEEPVDKAVEDDTDEAIYDPSASLVDDYHYDEYEDKKHFSTTDYKKIEEYLNSESAQGFHYARNDGNTYYFIKAKPHNYYYKVLYFADEPDEAYWEALEDEGWRRVDQSPSRHKKDAGWYIVRNEKTESELPKDIENEEEKYRYFSRLSSSCRSTMFLLFIVMVCSAVAVWLQYQFKGYIAVMIASAILFFVALWIFLVYARMLSKARKQASLLSARMRLADTDPEYQALRRAGESDEDLDRDWDNADQHQDEEKAQTDQTGQTQ